MTDREFDIPELHVALSAAAARAPRAAARRGRVLRLRVGTALCVLAFALVGVVGFGSATEASTAPTVGAERAPALRSVELWRCVLASLPATAIPELGAGRDGRAC